MVCVNACIRYFVHTSLIFLLRKIKDRTTSTPFPAFSLCLPLLHLKLSFLLIPHSQTSLSANQKTKKPNRSKKKVHTPFFLYTCLLVSVMYTMTGPIWLHLTPDDFSGVYSQDGLLVERQTRDQKVASSSPGKSSGRIFVPRFNFLL